MVAQFSRKLGAMTGRQRAAMEVEARRGALGMSRDDLAAKAQVDPKTVYNLEKNGKWPIARTRARIETALNWPSGEMGRIASAPDAQPDRPRIHPEVLRVINDAVARGERSPEWAADVIEALKAIERERGAEQGRAQQRHAG